MITLLLVLTAMPLVFAEQKKESAVERAVLSPSLTDGTKIEIASAYSGTVVQIVDEKRKIVCYGLEGRGAYSGTNFGSGYGSSIQCMKLE